MKEGEQAECNRKNCLKKSGYTKKKRAEQIREKLIGGEKTRVYKDEKILSSCP